MINKKSNKTKSIKKKKYLNNKIIKIKMILSTEILLILKV